MLKRRYFMKKLLSLGLAAAMVLPVAAVGTVGASAEGLAPGGFGTLGEYEPTAGVKTNRLMFAMPGAWQNDTTKNEKCGGAAGIYWWSGYDTPDNKAGGYGWPGYQAERVQEAGVPNLWAIDVPTYGNGEKGDALLLSRPEIFPVSSMTDWNIQMMCSMTTPTIRICSSMLIRGF